MIEKLYKIFNESTGVETDTRKITPGKLFFCLKGENFNANEFAAEALQKGAIAVVADEAEYATDKRIVLVDSVLETLQMLANYHRRSFDIPVLGITGTNGKTTTKELVTAALSAGMKTHSTSGNFNNHIGVPLTLLAMPRDTEIAVVEMGANHPGEIGELCRIAEPDYGIITNIGKAHLEGFGGLQGVINTKKELYDFVKSVGGKVFVDIENELLMDLSDGIKRITYGGLPEADYCANMISPAPFVSLKIENDIIKTNLLGNYNFTNVAAAYAVGRYFGVDREGLVKALSEYKPSNKRSQFLETQKNKIYLDAYNANPTSMDKALQSFAGIEIPHKIVILGDMLELGADSEAEHREIMEKVRKFSFDDAVFVGPEFVKVNNGSFKCFNDTAEALNYFKKNPVEGRFILLKGSRGIGLEKLLPVL